MEMLWTVAAWIGKALLVIALIVVVIWIDAAEKRRRWPDRYDPNCRRLEDDGLDKKD